MERGEGREGGRKGERKREIVEGGQRERGEEGKETEKER